MPTNGKGRTLRSASARSWKRKNHIFHVRFPANVTSFFASLLPSQPKPTQGKSPGHDKSTESGTTVRKNTGRYTLEDSHGTYSHHPFGKENVRNVSLQGCNLHLQGATGIHPKWPGPQLIGLQDRIAMGCKYRTSRWAGWKEGRKFAGRKISPQ